MKVLAIFALEDKLLLEGAVIDTNTLELKGETKASCEVCPLYCKPPFSAPVIVDLFWGSRITKRLLRCLNSRCRGEVFCLHLDSVPTYSRRTRYLQR